MPVSIELPDGKNKLQLSSAVEFIQAPHHRIFGGGEGASVPRYGGEGISIVKGCIWRLRHRNERCAILYRFARTDFELYRHASARVLPAERPRQIGQCSS